MDEEWRPVEGYEGLYEVSNLGRVKSLHPRNSGKIRALKVKRNGYIAVTLSRNGKLKTVTVHQLVAQAFIPNPRNLKEVNHLNEIKSDNRSENLAWATRRENVLYGTRGENHSRTMKERGYFKVPVVCTTLDNMTSIRYESLSAAAEGTGANISHISKCCRGKIRQTHGFQFKYEKTN